MTRAGPASAILRDVHEPPFSGIWYAIGVYCPVRFVETPVFTASLRRLLNDEQPALQLALVLRPDQGRLIPRGGGLRKLRWGAAGRGKCGGVRTIYYWAVAEDVCFMLYVYAKNEQGDLTAAQMRVLVRLVREEFK